MLTDRTIRQMKPSTRHRYVADGEGLYLRVHPSGKKQFVRRTRTGGKDTWDVLGDYPDMSLDTARDLVRGLLTTDSVAKVYAQFDRNVLARYARPDIPRSRFALDILPHLGVKRVLDVTRADVFAVLQGILDRGSPVAANRTLADLHHFFDYCVVRGYILASPIAGVTRKYVGGKEQPRGRFLSLDELHGALRLRESLSPMTAACLYLVLLTALRPSEALSLLRQSPTKRVVDTVDVKTGKPHKVYLSPQARAVLRFTRGLPVPKDHRVLSHALRRVDADFTPHDLRRTAATRMADAGIPPHVVEKMLNHKMEGVMAVYNHADYWEEQVAAYRLWGRMVSHLRKKTPA
jgi:integrase